MRTVKYRGKNIEHGPWIHGSLITDHTGSNNWPRIYTGPNGGAKNVIPHSVGQFTGLKDINGKEIYEGDICKIHYFGIGMGPNGGATETDNEMTARIVWSEKLCAFVFSTAKGKEYTFGILEEPSEDIEVIGNMFECPETLDIISIQQVL